MNLKKLIEIKEVEDHLQKLYFESGLRITDTVIDYLHTYLSFTTAVHSGRLNLDMKEDVVQYTSKNLGLLDSLLNPKETSFILELEHETILSIEEGKLTTFNNYYEDVFVIKAA